MAIKALMLRKRLDDARKQLEALRAKDEDFQTREAELEQAIAEAETEEEKATVEETVAAFADEQEKHEADTQALETVIAELETELENEERKAAPAAAKTENIEERKDNAVMNTRKFFNMTAQERDAFMAREDVKGFIARVREMMAQKRTVTGANLAIPTVILDVIRENILRYSKLYRHVNVRRVGGKARQIVAGTIPEAVWTEACATLNELDLTFTSVEVDGYKVGGYFAVCNALLEDSDIDLAAELISALGQAIGLALDKAILFGTDNKMPLGIVTRLIQTEAPDDAPVGARPWANLSTSNVKSIDADVTGLDFFTQLVIDSGAAKGVYSRGTKFWAMNESTYTSVIANAMSVNGAGAIVAGIDGNMPVIGGVIEVLPFIPDGVIVGGYGDLYLLAERAGTTIAQSEHAMFIEDQTVFKGTARYDGAPVIAEGFVAIGINGVTVATAAASVTFAPDEAN